MLRGPGLTLLLLFCASAPGVRAADDLSVLSDEFENAATLTNWTRAVDVEQRGLEPLEIWDIDTTEAGRMVMQPWTVTWYQDYRGPLAFKSVTGDFVLTVDVHARAHAGGIPSSTYSLAGPMIRTPRAITPETWEPFEEDYVFLSVGTGDQPGSAWQYEIKSTDDSISQLTLSPAPGGEVELRLARIGDAVIALRRTPGADWVVHARFARPDLPDTLQAGLVAYSDYATVSIFPLVVYNQIVIRPANTPASNPDLRASFGYARFARPVVPAELAGLDLTDPGQVSDAELLAFLGGPEPLGIPALGPAAGALLVLGLVLVVLARTRIRRPTSRPAA